MNMAIRISVNPASPGAGVGVPTGFVALRNGDGEIIRNGDGSPFYVGA